jgi:hypothetical protein
MEIIGLLLIGSLIIFFIGIGFVLGVFVDFYEEEDEDLFKEELELNKIIINYLLEKIKTKELEEERGKNENN